MRTELLTRLAALMLGSGLSLAAAQPSLPAGGAAPAPLEIVGSAEPVAAAFDDEWTGRPQNLADAQREARAAAAEARKACRRQRDTSERCLDAARRDNQRSLQRSAARGVAASPARSVRRSR